MELTKARVLVTGASRGIGAVLADALAARGADLVLVARSRSDLEAVRARVARHGTRVFAQAADLAERGALEPLVARALDDLGYIDLLVNNAGFEHMGFYEDLTPADIEAQIALNLTVPMRLSHLVLPEMLERRRGHILNMASIAGLAPFPFGETYGATKHGLVGFSRALRASLKERGSAVSVSCLCPGFVSDTGLYRELRDRYGIVPPRQLGRCTSDQVIKAALHAVEQDEPEVVVNSTKVREAAALGMASPRFFERLARTLRLYAPAHQLAQRRREELNRERAAEGRVVDAAE